MSSRELLISIARMHHISNPSKFRRLKRFAEHDSISGLPGKPGVLVFDGDALSIKAFLEHARGLRYLEFHHVDTRPFSNRSTGLLPRVADAKPGLQEVKDMHELVKRLQDVDEGLKIWFRSEMGMM